MYLNSLKTSIIFNRLKLNLILPEIEGPVEEPLHPSHLSRIIYTEWRRLYCTDRQGVACETVLQL